MGPLLFGVKRLLVGEPESFDEEEKETPNSQTQNKQSERKRGLFVIVWLFGVVFRHPPLSRLLIFGSRAIAGGPQILKDGGEDNKDLKANRYTAATGGKQEPKV